MTGAELTCDAILRGRLRLWQPRRGYRFAVDPMLLVHFIRGRLGRVCDLGTGSGVIALALALRDPKARVTAAELQPRLAGLARRNAEENDLASRVTVVEVDLADARAARRALPGASFDLCASNPPYQPLARGPSNPNDECAIARHELRLTLADLVREARRLLVPGGRAAIVYPAERLTDLLSALDAAALRPLRLRLVHDRAGKPASHALVEAKKGGKGTLTIEPALILRDGSNYTDEARALLGER